MAASNETDVVVRALVVVVLAVCLVMTWIWWRKRGQDREAMRKALPACVARLGSEPDCEARFDEHHQTCFTYNNRPASRFSPRAFDEAGYLECIVARPDGWLAARRAAKERRESTERMPLR